MNDNELDVTSPSSVRLRWVKPAGLVLAGLTAGGVLASSLSAYAASSPSPSPSSNAQETHDVGGAGDRDGQETAASASAISSVTSAVLAKYPAATVSKVEADSNGGYEAHVTTSSGSELRVTLDKAFGITGTSQGGGRGGHSNTDPAHEAKESPARVAEEKARDATSGSSTGQTG